MTDCKFLVVFGGIGHRSDMGDGLMAVERLTLDPWPSRSASSPLFRGWGVPRETPLVARNTEREVGASRFHGKVVSPSEDDRCLRSVFVTPPSLIRIELPAGPGRGGACRGRRCSEESLWDTNRFGEPRKVSASPHSGGRTGGRSRGWLPRSID